MAILNHPFSIYRCLIRITFRLIRKVPFHHHHRRRSRRHFRLLFSSPVIATINPNGVIGVETMNRLIDERATTM